METNRNATEERTQLYADVKAGKIPKRVPVSLNLDGAAALEYAGYNLRTEQFELDKVIDAMEKVARDFDSDNIGITMVRFAHFYKLLGARHFVMGADGFLQHPNIVAMHPEEYDELIADSYKFLWDKVIPRLYTELDRPWPHAAVALAKAYNSFFSTMGKIGAAKTEISYKYGKGISGGVFVQTDAPYDFIADLLRSFPGISIDIRRIPEKVLDGCKAILPLMIKAGATGTPSTPGGCMIPLHMAPYMREKDFKRFWWPTYKTLVEELVKTNTGVSTFLEHDFTRLIDYFADLPENCQLGMEFGDPQTFKDKLGKKHVLYGFYPVSLLKTGTRQQVTDKAKELIDILAPGGKYIFALDKSILRISDINVENYKTLLSFVKEYAVY